MRLRRGLADAHVRGRALWAHLGDRRRHGSATPRRHELIRVDPLACSRATLYFHKAYSGAIRAGDWDRDARPIDELDRMRFCRSHWEDGVPWEDTGAYEYVLDRIREKGRPIDGCRDLDDVRRRYERLDRVFDQVRREGRLRTQAEMRPRAFREYGGIYFSVGRDGEVIFTGYGHHRLAMARVLGLASVPGAIGYVHPAAMPDWRRGLLPDERSSEGSGAG